MQMTIYIVYSIFSLKLHNIKGILWKATDLLQLPNTHTIFTKPYLDYADNFWLVYPDTHTAPKVLPVMSGGYWNRTIVPHRYSFITITMNKKILTVLITFLSTSLWKDGIWQGDQKKSQILVCAPPRSSQHPETKVMRTLSTYQLMMEYISCRRSQEKIRIQLNLVYHTK